MRHPIHRGLLEYRTDASSSTKSIYLGSFAETKVLEVAGLDEPWIAHGSVLIFALGAELLGPRCPGRGPSQSK